MPTLTEVIPCTPPARTRATTTGPSTDLDESILYTVGSGAVGGVPLRHITDAVGGRTHKVHARVTVLVRRGLLVRRVLAHGPRRGPGASVYALTPEGQAWIIQS